MTGKELKAFVEHVHDDAIIEHDRAAGSYSSASNWEALELGGIRATLKPTNITAAAGGEKK